MYIWSYGVEHPESSIPMLSDECNVSIVSQQISSHLNTKRIPQRSQIQPAMVSCRVEVATPPILRQTYKGSLCQCLLPSQSMSIFKTFTKCKHIFVKTICALIRVHGYHCLVSSVLVQCWTHSFTYYELLFIHCKTCVVLASSYL